MNDLVASGSKEVGQPNVAVVDGALKRLGMNVQDLAVPRLILMQNTSDAVGDGKAKLGDIFNSQSLQVIGGFDKAVELIPMKLYKTWRVMDVSGKQAKYVREEPVTETNAGRKWEGVEDVEDWETGKVNQNCAVRYDLSYNFFALLKAEVEQEEAFPVVITFRRSSANAGKQLATHLFKREALGQLPFSKSVVIKIGKEKKDTNTYAVFEIHQGELTSDAGLKMAAQWFPLLDQMKAKVDEERTVEPAGGAPAPVVMGGSVEGSASGPY